MMLVMMMVVMVMSWSTECGTGNRNQQESSGCEGKLLHGKNVARLRPSRSRMLVEASRQERDPAAPAKIIAPGRKLKRQ